LKGYFRSGSVYFRADALPSALEQVVVRKKSYGYKRRFYSQQGGKYKRRVNYSLRQPNGGTMAYH
jgi:hypothetical protein